MPNRNNRILLLLALCVGIAGCKSLNPKMPERPPDAPSILRSILGPKYIFPAVQTNTIPLGSIVDSNGGGQNLVFSPGFCLKKFLLDDGHLNIATTGRASLPSVEWAYSSQGKLILEYFSPEVATDLASERIRTLRIPEFSYERIPVGQVDFERDCQLRLHERYQQRAQNEQLTDVHMVSEVLSASNIEIELTDTSSTNIGAVISKYGKHKMERTEKNTIRIKTPIFFAVGLAGRCPESCGNSPA